MKWGAVAGLADTAGQKKVLDQTLRIRNKAIADIKALGYEVLPTETNFFMVEHPPRGAAGHRGVPEEAASPWAVRSRR